jgi:hypothetical protein
MVSAAPGTLRRIAGVRRWTSFPLLTAVSIIIGTGGITFVFREWLWLWFCRDMHDKAVERG